MKPTANEFNQIEHCKKQGSFYYDMTKFLSFGEINPDLQFSTKGTKKLIRAILANNELEKLFIEPHLKTRLKLDQKTRLKLDHRKVRFHGCNAVRHDDHIHIQLK